MKNNIFSAFIFCAAVAMSTVCGCGGGNDPSQEAVPANVENQKTETSVIVHSTGDDGTPYRNTEPAQISKMQPAVQEERISQPAENIAQKAVPAKTADAPANASPDALRGQNADSNAAVSGKAESSSPEIMQSAAPKAADVITVENQGYATDKKGPVKFSHLKHNTDYNVSCDQCHHLYRDGENQWKEGDRADKCIVCHSPLEDKDKAVKLQNAFHKNCRDCHSNVNKEGREAPSTKCSDCHG